MTVLSCEFHGPLRHRPERAAWVCPGWDGEGCRNGLLGTDGISEEAYARVDAGLTYWPGADVDGVPWREARERLRATRSPRGT